jgi:hypothetical protein
MMMIEYATEARKPQADAQKGAEAEAAICKFRSRKTRLICRAAHARSDFADG